MFAVPLTADAELRPLNPWQAEEFLANLDRSRAHIAPWVAPSFVATDLDGARHVLQGYADRWARDDGGIWGIWCGGTLVGGVLLVSLNAARGVCEAGCWLEPAAEGRGLVTRAVTRLIDWVVDERGLHRVEWRTDARNARSIAVARRLGMRRDGVLRELLPGPEGRTDLEVWSVLAPEWRARRTSSAASG
ncbi:Protein N-acetyltransferase, RimJ/RimL family [Micromonospora nigra]|uniref:Protein N-acetyltransferase, RimJ/RimL family n=1 Tax=Micromonospora nigra TaxID=145857 RepID=A0A1C6RGC1_9ACTN|nr:GNAT family protein [Micromonospora nigra]SCL16195.1 Protein N-acetyltransferase, RimJ/RimL family [Micromonospora nigra]